MKFKKFEKIISRPRINRYAISCNGNTRKAMTLYRYNLKLSQKLFTLISCFEVALRNAIDGHYSKILGSDWLRDSTLPHGIFNNKHCGKTPYIILSAIRRLVIYSHEKLLAEMDFGFWRYIFARHQFFAGGQTLLQIFPLKPKSTILAKYDHNYIFLQLEKINELRNRLAHHEPVCFLLGCPIIDTTYVRQHYDLILQLFSWMSIDENELLYGLDHITAVCDEVDNLKKSP